MNEIFTAALELQEFCERRGWQFCFIGGVAVQRWSEPRFTADADLTLLTGFGGEEQFVRRLLDEFAARRDDALEFALANRVLLVKATNGIPLDIALGGLPFEERTIQRASAFLFPTGQSLTTCSAEDLMVHKVFAAREKDWLDVEGILARQGSKLNLDLVRRELEPLLHLQERPENLDRLERRIASYARTFTTMRPAPGGSGEGL